MNNNDDTVRLEVRPEVESFVAAVRGHFSDLDPDERDDLLGGLEADLSDLVADQGPGALGDPAAYAAELRQAAGLPLVRRRSVRELGWRGAAERTERLLDGTRSWTLDALAKLPWGAGDVVTVLRPAWWVLRAWAAVALLNALVGNDVELLPTPSRVAGLLLVGAAVVFSVLVGVGRVWPGGRRGLVARLVLLCANALLLVVAPVMVGEALSNLREAGFREGATAWRGIDDGQSGVWMDGRQVCNLQPFDAQGNPLQGVQLFDQTGRAVDVRCDDIWGPRRDLTAYPWMLGDVPRWNVFPQAEREQRGRYRQKVDPGAYESSDKPAFPVSDRRTVPGVSHPLVAAEPEAGGGDPGARKDGADKGGADKDGARKDASGKDASEE